MSRTSADSPDTTDIYTIDEGDFDSETLARDVAALTWDIKALNTRVIDLRGLVSYTDFVVICSATSPRQIQAIARHVQNELAKVGFQAIGVEGVESGEWALIDFGDVVLHIFDADAREAYDIERMWPEAHNVDLADKPEELYGRFELEQLRSRSQR